MIKAECGPPMFGPTKCDGRHSALTILMVCEYGGGDCGLQGDSTQ